MMRATSGGTRPFSGIAACVEPINSSRMQRYRAIPRRRREGGGSFGPPSPLLLLTSGVFDTKPSDTGQEETGVFFPILFCRWKVLGVVVLTDLEGMSCLLSPVPVMRAFGTWSKQISIPSPSLFPLHHIWHSIEYPTQPGPPAPCPPSFYSGRRRRGQECALPLQALHIRRPNKERPQAKQILADDIIIITLEA